MQKLDDDIKIAALESLVPQELEQHLAMNRSRLPDYESVQLGRGAYIEARQSQGAHSPTKPPKNRGAAGGS
eukprot:7360559-Heterocapsa_arctica.AAC.1